MTQATNTKTNKLSAQKILALYRKGANGATAGELNSIIEKLQEQCIAHGKKLSEIIPEFRSEHHKIELFDDINADGTLEPKAAKTLYKLMGKYIKDQLAIDPNYFKNMANNIDRINDVKSNMDPKSKYYTKDPISCIKWYEAELRRKAREAA